MTDEERNRLYRQMADTFINQANQHAQQHNNVMVSSAFLYGAARFSAFVTAVQAGEQGQYDADREAALDYFTAEFRRMLTENLDDYRRVFTAETAAPAPAASGSANKQQPQRILSYEHLVKKG